MAPSSNSAAPRWSWWCRRSPCPGRLLVPPARLHGLGGAAVVGERAELRVLGRSGCCRCSGRAWEGPCRSGSGCSSRSGFPLLVSLWTSEPVLPATIVPSQADRPAAACVDAAVGRAVRADRRVLDRGIAPSGSVQMPSPVTVELFIVTDDGVGGRDPVAAVAGDRRAVDGDVAGPPRPRRPRCPRRPCSKGLSRGSPALRDDCAIGVRVVTVEAGDARTAPVARRDVEDPLRVVAVDREHVCARPRIVFFSFKSGSAPPSATLPVMLGAKVIVPPGVAVGVSVSRRAGCSRCPRPCSPSGRGRPRWVLHHVGRRIPGKVNWSAAVVELLAPVGGDGHVDRPRSLGAWSPSRRSWVSLSTVNVADWSPTSLSHR